MAVGPRGRQAPPGGPRRSAQELGARLQEGVALAGRGDGSRQLGPRHRLSVRALEIAGEDVSDFARRPSPLTMSPLPVLPFALEADSPPSLP